MAQKFRSRKIVEAVQWTGSNKAEVEELVGCDVKLLPSGAVIFRKVHLEYEVKLSYWITCDNWGELTPYTPAEFASEFELQLPLHLMRGSDGG